jgi:hypothetical protein
MGGTCGGCGGRGEAHPPEGNGLGGNNVAGTGMSVNDIARALAYGSQGLADQRTIGNNGMDAPSLSDPSPAVDAAVTAAGGTDASPVNADRSPAGGNCNCTDD